MSERGNRATGDVRKDRATGDVRETAETAGPGWSEMANAMAAGSDSPTRAVEISSSLASAC